MNEKIKWNIYVDVFIRMWTIIFKVFFFLTFLMDWKNFYEFSFEFMFKTVVCSLVLRNCYVLNILVTSLRRSKKKKLVNEIKYEEK